MNRQNLGGETDNVLLMWIYWTSCSTLATGIRERTGGKNWDIQGRQNQHQLHVSLQSTGENYQLQENESAKPEEHLKT